MNKEILIVNYGLQWENSHIEFAKTFFHGRRKRINPDYIYWKFRGVPGEELRSFLLAVEGEKVVGQLGLVPAQIKLNNTVYDIQWACDLMVDDAYRGKGIADKLYKEAVSRKITFGSDPSPAASISMKRFGFKEMMGPVKLFFPLRLSAIFEKKLKWATKYFGSFYNPFLLFYWLVGFKRIFNHLMKNEISTYSEISDSIKVLEEKNSVYIKRDEDFYNWRLRKFKDYQKDGKLIFKENSFLLTLRNSGMITFIGDLRYKNIKDAKKCIQTAIYFASINKSKELKLMTNDSSLVNFLKSWGFLAFRTPTSIIYYSDNEKFNQEISSLRFFEYTFIDSDENI